MSFPTVGKQSAVVVSHSCQAKRCCRIPQLSGRVLLSYPTAVRRSAVVVSLYCQAMRCCGKVQYIEHCCPIPKLSGGALLSNLTVVRRSAVILLSSEDFGAVYHCTKSGGGCCISHYVTNGLQVLLNFFRGALLHFIRDALALIQ